ncbi:unnamed protein product [Euphydryas editha]|uniref:Uncharacterized protein n=1 Tax=Euphydryas editha TaxID=104508 RepID=A0AAU9TIL0_EUPED|nr:unnamed protein product [Euphydryas editha]
MIQLVSLIHEANICNKEALSYLRRDGNNIIVMCSDPCQLSLYKTGMTLKIGRTIATASIKGNGRQPTNHVKTAPERGSTGPMLRGLYLGMESLKNKRQAGAGK